MITPSSDVVLLLHVDDILCLCENRSCDKLQNALKKHYTVAVQVLHDAGDEIDFLKRKHVLISSSEMVIQPHPKHFDKIFELLGIRKTLKGKKTPCHALLDEVDDTAELSASDAKAFRSCVGVLFYLASDLVECQYCIRSLAQRLSKPTERALVCLRHLGMYLLHAKDQALLFRPSSPDFW